MNLEERKNTKEAKRKRRKYENDRKETLEKAGYTEEE